MQFAGLLWPTAPQRLNFAVLGICRSDVPASLGADFVHVVNKP